MIEVPFEEPIANAAWNAWRKKADDRTGKLKEKLLAGELVRISEALYKEQRQVFLDAFHGKCAYCEAKVILDQHHGDVEHFRPKGRVTDPSGKPITIAGNPPRQHPGYPWLAYDPHNLLPSCVACKRPATTRHGKRVGKWDQFPVGRFRASVPGQESRERPLLLHPGLENVERHLILDPATGILGWKSRKGKVTIELLNLNREGLPEERRKIFRAVRAQVMQAQVHLDRREFGLAREYLDEIASYREGSAAWSWAGRLALDALAPPPSPAERHGGRVRSPAQPQPSRRPRTARARRGSRPSARGG